MKKFTPYLVLFFAGLLVLGFIFRNKLESYFPVENDFNISDTAVVGRIEIISKDSIILTRAGNAWTHNGESPANSIAVNNFLFSFMRMSVKGINSNPDISDVKAIRVKIFEGRRKHFFRFYEIDGVAFMHKEGARKFYAIEVKGSPDIKLEEVINPDPDHWKDRTLLNLMSRDIREVSVLHPIQPEKDFLIRVSEGKPVLFDGVGKEVPDSLADKEKLNFYLSYFTNVFYDYSEKTGVQPEQDARWIIRIEDKAGKKSELMIFPLMNSTGEDMFRALVKYNGQPGYKVTRYMVLDLLLQEKEHFILHKSTSSQKRN
jgi:hypothetical protein